MKAHNEIRIMKPQIQKSEPLILLYPNDTPNCSIINYTTTKKTIDHN